MSVAAGAAVGAAAASLSEQPIASRSAFIDARESPTSGGGLLGCARESLAWRLGFPAHGRRRWCAEPRVVPPAASRGPRAAAGARGARGTKSACGLASLPTRAVFVVVVVEGDQKRTQSGVFPTKAAQFTRWRIVQQATPGLALARDATGRRGRHAAASSFICAAWCGAGRACEPNKPSIWQKNRYESMGKYGFVIVGP